VEIEEGNPIGKVGSCFAERESPHKNAGNGNGNDNASNRRWLSIAQEMQPSRGNESE